MNRFSNDALYIYGGVLTVGLFPGMLTLIEVGRRLGIRSEEFDQALVELLKTMK